MGSPSLVAVRQVIAEISPIPLPGGFGITFFLMNERGLGWESKYMTISCRARSYSSQVPSVAWAPQFSRRCDKNCRCCLQISTPFTFYKGSLEVGNRYRGVGICPYQPPILPRYAQKKFGGLPSLLPEDTKVIIRSCSLDPGFVYGGRPPCLIGCTGLSVREWTDVAGSSPSAEQSGSYGYSA